MNVSVNCCAVHYQAAYKILNYKYRKYKYRKDPSGLRSSVLRSRGAPDPQFSDPAGSGSELRDPGII